MVQNVLSDKKINLLGGKLFRKDTGSYSDMDNYYNYLMEKGLYVFSGNGLTFPDIVDHNRKPFEKETKKRNIGFGTSYSTHNLNPDKKRFLISTGKYIFRNINKVKEESIKMIKEREEA